MCVPSCPDQYYNSYYDYKAKSADEEDFIGNVNQCIPCHYTCRICNGSNDYQCAACFPDALLFERSTVEFYCYPSSVVNDILSEKWNFRMFVLLGIVLVVVVTLALWKICSNNNEVKFRHLDTLKHIRDVERSAKGSVYSDSDWFLFVIYIMT